MGALRKDKLKLWLLPIIKITKALQVRVWMSVGQRILPAFAGMRLLWSTKLMFASLLLTSIGCGLRVSCEVLAYQDYAAWAWQVLPVSALLELSGLTIFAISVGGTF